MRTLIHALILGTFATVAVAQTPAPAPDSTDKQQKQQTVKEATEKGYQQSGRSSAEGSAKAAATKSTPKALTDKKSKQQAAKATTEAGYAQSGRTAAEGSAKAAADTTPKQPKPKMGEHQKALEKAATP